MIQDALKQAVLGQTLVQDGGRDATVPSHYHLPGSRLILFTGSISLILTSKELPLRFTH